MTAAVRIEGFPSKREIASEKGVASEKGIASEASQ
jgi:hypothetical protein